MPTEYIDKDGWYVPQFPKMATRFINSTSPLDKPTSSQIRNVGSFADLADLLHLSLDAHRLLKRSNPHTREGSIPWASASISHGDACYVWDKLTKE